MLLLYRQYVVIKENFHIWLLEASQTVQCVEYDRSTYNNYLVFIVPKEHLLTTN